MYIPPPELKVNWVKSHNGWLFLDTLNLQDPALNDAIGVYILWTSKEIVKVGGGRIREELAKDKTSRELMGCKDLMVTWCKVEEDKVEGAKSYLMGNMKPKKIENLTELDALKVSLNSPW